MEKSEVTILLTKAGLVDGRKLHAERVDTWHSALSHLTFDQAVEALTYHHQTNTEYVQPAHITGLVKLLEGRKADQARREIERKRVWDAPPPPLTDEEKARLNQVYREGRVKARAERGIFDPLPDDDLMFRGVPLTDPVRTL